MKCKVVKVYSDATLKKESKLYQELRKDMNEEDALRAFLDIQANKKAFARTDGLNSLGEISSKAQSSTAKFKEAEFATTREQTEAMQYVTDVIINDLKNNTKAANPYSISGLDMVYLQANPEVIKTAIHNSSQHIREHAKHVYLQAIKGDAATKKYGVNLMSKMSSLANKINQYLLNPDMSLGPLGIALAEQGIKIGSRGTYRLELKENMSLEDDQDIADTTDAPEFTRIYDIDILETSIRATMSDDVKVYLKNLGRPAPGTKLGKNKDSINYELTAYGTAVRADLNKIEPKLYAIGADSISFDNFMDRLEQSLKTSPELIPLYLDLTQERGIPLNNGRIYSPIASEIYSTFSTSNYDMVTQAKVGKSMRLVDSNFNSTKKRMSDVWRYELEQTRQDQGEAAQNRLLERVRSLIGSESFEKRINAMYVHSKGNTAESLNKALTQGRGSNKTTEVFESSKTAEREFSKGLSDVERVFKAVGYTSIDTDVLRNALNMAENSTIKETYRETPAKLMRHLVSVLVEKPLSGKDIFSDKFEQSEKRTISFMASIAGATLLDTTVSSFKTAKGAVKHAIHLGSESQQVFKRVMNDSMSAEALMFNNDVMYKDTNLMQLMNTPEARDPFRRQRYFTELSDSSAFIKAQEWDELSPMDALGVKMNMYFMGGAPKGYVVVGSPTIGDRGKMVSLTVPMIGNAGNKVISKGAISSSYKPWVQRQVVAETARIMAEMKKPNPRPGHMRFHLFTGLNSIVDQISSNMKGRDSIPQDYMERVIFPKVAEDISAMIEADKRSLIDNGLISRGYKDEYKPTDLGGRILNKGVSSGGKSDIISGGHLENFIFNNIAYTYEQTLFYSGDPAFYYKEKSSYGKVDQVATDMATYANINKRLALSFTPGQRRASGDKFALEETSKIVALKNPVVDTEFTKYAREELGYDYANLELADGYGMASLERYLQLTIGKKLISKDMVRYLQEEMRWRPGDVKPVMPEGGKLPVLKMFYFKIQEIDGVATPMSLKYELAPVIPSYFEGRSDFSGMAKISEKLRNSSIREIVSPSAIKTGKMPMSDIGRLKDAKSIVIHNNAFVQPQPMTAQDKSEDTFGSTVRKLILARYNKGKDHKDLQLDGSYVDAKVAVENYHRAIDMMTDIKGSLIKATLFNSEGSINRKNIEKELIRNVENSQFMDDTLFKEALHGIVGEMDALGLDHPSVSYKVDTLINSMYKNAVNRMKLPGHAAVQISSLGTKPSNARDLIGSDLKFLGKDKDGYTTPAEIRLTPKFFSARLKKIAKQNIDKGGIQRQTAEFKKAFIRDNRNALPAVINQRTENFKNTITKEAYDRKYKNLKNQLTNSDGTFSIDKVRSLGLDEVFLYRVPTQDKSSMLPAVIKDFLPDVMDATIQVPAEIVKQAGSDFDIDKVFIETSNFTLDDRGSLTKVSSKPRADGTFESMEVAKQYIKEFKSAVLKHPSTFKDLTNPLDGGRLKELASNVNTAGHNFYTMTTQENFRYENKSGSRMISIAAIANAGNAVAQMYGSHFIKTTIIGGRGLTLQGDMSADTKGSNPKKISDKLKTILDGITNPTLKSKIGPNLLRLVDNPRNKTAASQLRRDLQTVRGGNYTADIAVLTSILESVNVASKIENHTINSEINEILNAALDNANDPVLGKLNINPTTAPAALLLVATGFGLKLATDLVGNPIVRDYVKEFEKRSRLYSKKRATEDSIEAVLKKHNQKAENVDLKSLDLSSIGETANEASAKILDVFMKISNLGNDLSDFNAIMNFDSKGVPAYATDVRDKYIKMAKIPGTSANAYENLQRKIELRAKPHKIKASSTDMDTLFEESSKISFSKEQGSFVYKESDQHKPIVMNQSSRFSIKTTLDSEASVAAVKVGSSVDNFGRLFLEGNKPDTLDMVVDGVQVTATETAAKNLTKLLDKFKKTLPEGSTIVTDPAKLKVFNRLSEVAGEMDILVQDKDGFLDIYDLKTEKYTTPEEMLAGQQDISTIKEARKRFNDREYKYKIQLNKYKDLLKDMIGVEVRSLNIVAVKPVYTTSKDGSIHISDVKGTPKLIKTYEKQVVIPTSKEKHLRTGAGLVPGADLAPSALGVSSKYMETHAAMLEEYTLHEPLRANKEIGLELTPVMLNMVDTLRNDLKNSQSIDSAAVRSLAMHTKSYVAANPNAINLNTEVMTSRIVANVAKTRELTGNGANSLGYRINQHLKADRESDNIPNLFLQNLRVEKVNGRNYVIFQNSTGSKILKETKIALKEAYLDLYEGNAFERQLAQDLAEYALTHYGYATGSNSFMSYLPAIAHSQFLGVKFGDNQDVYTALDKYFRDDRNKYSFPKEALLESWLVTRGLRDIKTAIDPWRFKGTKANKAKRAKAANEAGLGLGDMPGMESEFGLADMGVGESVGLEGSTRNPDWANDWLDSKLADGSKKVEDMPKYIKSTDAVPELHKLVAKIDYEAQTYLGRHYVRVTPRGEPLYMIDLGETRVVEVAEPGKNISKHQESQATKKNIVVSNNLTEVNDTAKDIIAAVKEDLMEIKNQNDATMFFRDIRTRATVALGSNGISVFKAFQPVSTFFNNFEKTLKTDMASQSITRAEALRRRGQVLEGLMNTIMKKIIKDSTLNCGK